MNRFLILAKLAALTYIATNCQAQVQRPEYFKDMLLKGAGVKMISVFETKVDNPPDLAGKGNRIRLARNMVRQTNYDHEGLPIHTTWFQNQGRTKSAEANRTFDGQGKLLLEIQGRFNTNLADSTRLLQTTRTSIRYDGAGKQLSRVQALMNKEVAQLVDSISYVWDTTGKLMAEQVYDYQDEPRLVLKKQYQYFGNKVTVRSLVEDQELNRDEFELDENGRVVRELNFGPGDQRARLETIYRYDPRGWLEEIRFVPDWQHFEASETVVCRKNKYDDHGKIIEAQLDFGNGKRRFEFYDYTYWIEK